MQINLGPAQPLSQDTLNLIFVDQSDQTQSSALTLPDAVVSMIESALNSGLLAQAAKSTYPLLIADADALFSVLLVRLPKRLDSANDFCGFAAALAGAISKADPAHALIDLDALVAIASEQIAVAQLLSVELDRATYRYDTHKSTRKTPGSWVTTTLISTQPTSHEIAVARGSAVAAGIQLAKDLGNCPANFCTPTDLAETAKQLATAPNASLEVLEESDMRELGMGSLLSVTAGTVQPAKLIVLKYTGASEQVAPYALVGKGITFDSGGISLKPGAGMDEMKYDMGGAASVLGTFKAITDLQLPINLVVVVAAAENMPAGNATKPGDVVTSMAGKTIEVLNTDAEGRLVLCDALTYVAQFEPKTIIDVATLTGACIIALGSHASGLYANDDELGEALINAGSHVNDRGWRMPLWNEYTKQLKSNFADLGNIGGREAGSVTAACFLQEFMHDQKWAHLDVAGTAWKSGAAKGATGRPVALLSQYLMDQA